MGEMRLNRGFLVLLSGVLAVSLCGCRQEQASAKPVLYLYPETETEVEVTLDYDGELTCTWPECDGRWQVTARPDGTLTDEAGNEYSYLFWEGKTSAMDYDFSRGFCVTGAETGAFLRDVLAQMGLTPKEYNEFIVYWLPQMRDNAYNLISFQGESYTDHARLTVSPEPDSVLRVFMAWKPAEEAVEPEPQTFRPLVREGFTVVEWGGVLVK